MAHGPNPVQNKINFIYTNKVLLAHSPTHLFTDCLLSHHNGRVELLDKRPYGPQTQDIYCLPFTESLLIPLLLLFLLIRACILSSSNIQVGLACEGGGRVTGVWKCHLVSLSPSYLTLGGCPVGVSPPPPFFSQISFTFVSWKGSSPVTSPPLSWRSAL